MPVLTINPEASKRPYLTQGGEYGNNRNHDCDCEIFKLEMPSEHGPGWDYECKKESYIQFTFIVTHSEMGKVFVTHHEPLGANTGSKALEYLYALAPEVVDLDAGTFDIDAICPRPCAIEVKDPVEDKRNPGLWYTGNVTSVYGA